MLTFNLKVLGFESAGLANLCAAVAGISASFLGNRFFVFAAAEPQPLLTQAIKFSGLYGAIAVLHGAVLWLLSGYCFAISVPTVIDRSLSFYILEKLQQRGGGILHDRFADVFAKEYLKEHRLVDVRLTEQQASGTIVIENGCVKLTPKGQQLAGASRYFRQHFLPKQRLLMGEYSSDLTDPFRNSAPIEDYKCQ